jgi:uncharacterized protein (DUF58 family)
VALASDLGESFEYLGNREYREGDNIRDIDWRATARLGMSRGAMGGVPIVREWVEEYMLRVAVVLDTHVPKTGRRAERREREEAFERAVSVAASVADYMARQDYLVDLFAAGPDLYHLTAGRSLAYLEQILDILACVQSSPEPTFGTIEPKLMELLDRLSTVILVLTKWDPEQERLSRLLAEHGVAVKIIVVGEMDAARLPPGGSVVTRELWERGVDQL